MVCFDGLELEADFVAHKEPLNRVEQLELGGEQFVKGGSELQVQTLC